MTKITINSVKEAIKGSRGIKKNIIDNLGCTYMALDNFIRKNPKVLDLIKEEEQNLGDKIEDELYNIANMETKDPKLLNSKLKAMQLYLQSKKAINRGFCQISEIKTTTKEDEDKNNIQIEKFRALSPEEQTKFKEVLGWDMV